MSSLTVYINTSKKFNSKPNIKLAYENFIGHWEKQTFQGISQKVVTQNFLDERLLSEKVMEELLINMAKLPITNSPQTEDSLKQLFNLYKSNFCSGGLATLDQKNMVLGLALTERHINTHVLPKVLPLYKTKEIFWRKWNRWFRDKSKFSRGAQNFPLKGKDGLTWLTWCNVKPMEPFNFSLISTSPKVIKEEIYKALALWDNYLSNVVYVFNIVADKINTDLYRPTICDAENNDLFRPAPDKDSPFGLTCPRGLTQADGRPEGVIFSKLLLIDMVSPQMIL